MTHLNRQFGQSSIWLATTGAVALFISTILPTGAHAESWELRTTSYEVPGTREIESGKPEQGIRISRIRLSVAPENQKVAILTNLCIGYMSIGDYDQAETYCDQAVSRPKQRAVTYNNRGVLRALQGDFKAAALDFAIAAESGCVNGCDPNIAVPQDLPRPVARRNLARAEVRILAEEAAEQSRQQAARVD
jgi:Flp pilus assembly protein TadD